MTNPITLTKPLQRGEQQITSITLREPSAGELRGVNLISLAQMDVQALITVLPRVTQPTLTEPEVAALPPADLMSLGVAVVGFLIPPGALGQSASKTATPTLQ